MASLASPTIIFLDLPPKTFVGINRASFQSSPAFKGITNLPIGLHFAYTGTDASLSIRQGLWLNIVSSTTKPRIITLKWNTDLEQLDVLPPTSLVVQNASQYLAQAQNRNLVDYAALRQASVKLQAEQNRTAARNGNEDQDEDNGEDIWQRLTSHISTRLLSRILTSSELTTATPQSWRLSSISSSPLDTEHIPGLSTTEASSVLSQSVTLNFLPIDLKKTWPENAIGRDRTDKARDRSWYLSHLISTLSPAGNGLEEVSQQVAAGELVGELQFCFLMVLTLANYSCLEQWKRILSVLLTCKAALIEAEMFFVKVVKVLHDQLRRIEDVEGGLFDLADEMGSKWLRQLLRSLRTNVDEIQAKHVAVVLGELEKWLEAEYDWTDGKNMLMKGMVQLEDGEMVEVQLDGWDEEEEDGEYAPVVVET